MSSEIVSGSVHELFRTCEAVPVEEGGSSLQPEQLSPGSELVVMATEGDIVTVERRGTAPVQRRHYHVRRDELKRAITPPADQPREGQAPTAPATTAGSPD
jgi:hypothetical protein